MNNVNTPVASQIDAKSPKSLTTSKEVLSPISKQNSKESTGSSKLVPGLEGLYRSVSDGSAKPP